MPIGNSIGMHQPTRSCSFLGSAVALFLAACQGHVSTSSATDPPDSELVRDAFDVPISTRSEPAAPTVVGHSPAPLALAVDETFIYWTDASGYLFRALKRGGEQVVLSPGVGAPGIALTIDAARVFWAAPGAAKIAEVDKLGGPTTVVADKVAPQDLATDGAALFFPEPYRLMKVPANGEGTVSFVMPCSTAPIVLDADNAYTPFVTGIGLRRISKDGWMGSTLGKFDGRVVSLASYWGSMFVATDQDAVYRVRAGGDATEAAVKISEGLHVNRIAVDGSGIYATTKGRGRGGDSVLRIPFDGGEPIVLAANRHAPGAIVLDDEWIYWIESGSDEVVWHDFAIPTVEKTGSPVHGTVLRIRKP
jgi:hypothetical protein